MIPIWNRVGELLDQLKDKKVLILTDFDGTLHEIVPNPSAAKLSKERRRVLVPLHRGLHRLGVITGRSLPDIRKRVGIPGIPYGANCGLIVEGDGQSYLHPGAKAARPKLELLAHELRRAVKEIPDFYVQDKEWSLGLPETNGQSVEDKAKLYRRLGRLRDDARFKGLRWMPRGLAWEIVPDVPWNKGEAALWLWRRFGKPFLITMGDDEIDESMFQVTHGRGLSVRVGGPSKHSAADAWIKDVPDAYRFLLLLPRPPGA